MIKELPTSKVVLAAKDTVAKIILAAIMDTIVAVEDIIIEMAISTPAVMFEQEA